MRGLLPSNPVTLEAESPSHPALCRACPWPQWPLPVNAQDSQAGGGAGQYLYTCSSSPARGHGRPTPSWGLEALRVLALEPYTGDGDGGCRKDSAQSLPGEEKEQPESPPEGSCSQPVSSGSFHTLTRRQVINTWSLPPHVAAAGGESQTLPASSPYFPDRWLPEPLPDKLLVP